MTSIQPVLGWVGLIVLALFFAGLVYVDVSSRRLLRQAIEQNPSDADLKAKASAALQKGFYARVRWLKSNRHEAARFTFNVYLSCVFAMIALVILWAAAMAARP